MMLLSGHIADFDPFQKHRPCFAPHVYRGWCTEHNKALCPGCGVCPRDAFKHESFCRLRGEGRLDRGPVGSNLVGRPKFSNGAWARADVFTPYGFGASESSRYLVHVLAADDFSAVTHSDDYAAECSCCWLGFAHSEKKHAAALGCL